MGLNNQGIKKLNFRNDFLLNEDKIFIDGSLNIYGVLIKKKDMQINKKGMVLKKCPYACDENDKIKALVTKLEDYNFITLRQAFSDYLGIKRIRKDTFYNWLNKKVYPLPLVRIIYFLSNKNILELLKDITITDFCQKSQIRIPSTYQALTSDFMAYLIGLHIGDGTLNKERWKIADGDRNPKNLRYSYTFLTYIKVNIEKIFSTDSIKVYKVKGKNAYELILSNKWFCRFLNVVYQIEYNRKESPLIPPFLNVKKELVLRGLFDTDGSIKKYRIIFGTKYSKLHDTIQDILEIRGISVKERIIDNKIKNKMYILEIKKEYITKFIKIIGFSHPRKLLEIKKYLLSNSSLRNFIGFTNYKPKISEKEFVELCKYVRPIKNSGKIRFISKFRGLDLNKRKSIIKNFKINFNTHKNPNKLGYVNSTDIERIFTNYCRYEGIRKPMDNKEIVKVMENLIAIWG